MGIPVEEWSATKTGEEEIRGLNPTFGRKFSSSFQFYFDSAWQNFEIITAMLEPSQLEMAQLLCKYSRLLFFEMAAMSFPCCVNLP